MEMYLFYRLGMKIIGVMVRHTYYLISIRAKTTKQHITVLIPSECVVLAHTTCIRVRSRHKPECINKQYKQTSMNTTDPGPLCIQSVPSGISQQVLSWLQNLVPLKEYRMHQKQTLSYKYCVNQKAI